MDARPISSGTISAVMIGVVKKEIAADNQLPIENFNSNFSIVI